MLRTSIVQVTARMIFDSRGLPTVEADVHLADGSCGRASVPSGASTGTYEALELRDGGPAYHGKGVSQAVRNITDRIRPHLVGQDALDQGSLDRLMLELDSTQNKSALGANAILAVSLAAARAAAIAQGMGLYRYLAPSGPHPLPMPQFNVLNGGKHASNNLTLQEFMLIPVGATSFRHAMQMAVEVYSTLKSRLMLRQLSVTVGDEGGFAPDLDQDEDALTLLVDAIRGAGYRPGEDLAISLDPAATSFWEGGAYRLGREVLSSADLVSRYAKWVARYPIIQIEDGLAEDDWDGWAILTRRLGHQVQLIGDDLFVTQVTRLHRGVVSGIANGILIKPNQVGTITETLQTITFARSHDYATVVSHRSGETEDTFIADLAVGWGLGQIKCGAPCRGERVA